MSEIIEDDEFEKATSKHMRDLRQCIAARWKYLLSLKGKVPEKHFNLLLLEMKEYLEGLIEIHGTSLPFCPFPKESLGVNIESIKQLKDPFVSSSHTAASTTASTPSSGPRELPHEFKFLQFNGITNEVWTCAQAWGNKGQVETERSPESVVACLSSQQIIFQSITYYSYASTTYVYTYI